MLATSLGRCRKLWWSLSTYSAKHFAPAGMTKVVLVVVVVNAKDVPIEHLLIVGLGITVHSISAPTIRQIVMHNQSTLSLLYTSHRCCRRVLSCFRHAFKHEIILLVCIQLWCLILDCQGRIHHCHLHVCSGVLDRS